jgi:hypothetical protein
MREGWCYADALLAANDLHERAVGDERLSAARPSKERSAPRVIVVLQDPRVSRISDACRLSATSRRASSC